MTKNVTTLLGMRQYCVFSNYKQLISSTFLTQNSGPETLINSRMTLIKKNEGCFYSRIHAWFKRLKIEGHLVIVQLLIRQCRTAVTYWGMSKTTLGSFCGKSSSRFDGSTTGRKVYFPRDETSPLCSHSSGGPSVDFFWDNMSKDNLVYLSS